MYGRDLRANSRAIVNRLVLGVRFTDWDAVWLGGHVRVELKTLKSLQTRSKSVQGRPRTSRERVGALQRTCEQTAERSSTDSFSASSSRIGTRFGLAATFAASSRRASQPKNGQNPFRGARERAVRGWSIVQAHLGLASLHGQKSGPEAPPSDWWEPQPALAAAQPALRLAHCCWTQPGQLLLLGLQPVPAMLLPSVASVPRIDRIFAQNHGMRSGLRARLDARIIHTH